MLVAFAAVVAASAWIAVVSHFDPVWPGRQLPWLVVAGAMVLVQLLTVRFPMGEGTVAVGLFEIPVVVGVVFLSPQGLLISTAASLAVVSIVERRAPSKAAFNVFTHVVAAAASFVAYDYALGSASPISVRGWAAAAAVVAVFILTTALAVVSAISVSTRRVPQENLFAALSTAVPGIPVNVVLGVIAVSVIWANRMAGLFFVALGLAGVLIQRSSTEFRRRYANLERLYRFTERTREMSEVADVVPSLLREAREVLAAGSAEILLPRPSGDVAYLLDGDDRLARSRCEKLDALEAMARKSEAGFLVRRSDCAEEIRSVLAERGLREALAAPIAIGNDAQGVLIVGDQQRPVSFDAEDLRLFEVIASHAGVAIRGALLLDRLRDEVTAREHEALHDGLTGLANRSLFDQALRHALVGRALGQLVAVMLMDLDGFKEINDTMGHYVGDSILREIGDRLAALVSGRGVVARLGGDEFGFVLPDLASVETIAELSQEILDELERPVQVDGLALSMRGSLGTSIVPEHGEDPSLLLRRADIAMYAAKSVGGGMAIYDPMSDNHSTRRLILATELRAARQRDLIEVWFQPEADMKTGQVIGCEALARWNHPHHGDIAPEEFIPLAEQSGDIGELTWDVLKTALRQTREWHEHGLFLNVSVNMSARTLLEADLVERLTRLLDESGVPPSKLTLELTESSIVADPVRSGGVLKALGQIGIRLAIDDFGTGHSSLTRLKRLPIHIVKIDRSFVMSMSVDDGDAAIVRSTVELGRSLGHTVVAEGVEDQVTWDQLTAMGCDRAQGFHLARAMPGAAIAGWVSQRRRGNLSLVLPTEQIRGA